MGCQNTSSYPAFSPQEAIIEKETTRSTVVTHGLLRNIFISIEGYLSWRQAKSTLNDLTFSFFIFSS